MNCSSLAYYCASGLVLANIAGSLARLLRVLILLSNINLLLLLLLNLLLHFLSLFLLDYIPSPIVRNFNLTFCLYSLLHFGEEIETILHCLDIFLIVSHLKIPEEPLYDQRCVDLQRLAISLIPLGDEPTIPFLYNHHLVKHLFNLPDANLRETRLRLALVSPPCL